ncbi:MAG: PAS domain-containing protein [Labilithrix sp.]
MTSGSSEHAWALEAVAHIDDGLMVIDTAVNIVYMNRAAERLVGPDELWHPTTWTAEHGIFHQDRVTLFQAEALPLIVAAQSRQPQRDYLMFARTRSRPEGFYIGGSAIPLYEPQSDLYGAVVIFRDVTQSLKREAQLQESERQKKAILDNIPDIAWLKDREGRYIGVNQRLAEAANRARPEDVVGLTDHDLWPADLAEGYRADDEEVMREGGHKFVEEQFVNLATQQRYWIETVKTRIVDDNGKVLGTTGIAHDVTARRLAHKELERAVEERTAELREAQENLVRQERLAVLGQLAGGVAHQIRNPLAAIMNASYVLKRHLAPQQHSDVGAAIRIIHDEVRHANIIITGLLDYARVREPDRHPTSLVELLERILGADWIPDTVRITRELPPGDPVLVEVDADQLAGAISNLVRNAIEAMPGGGELRVVLARDGGEIRIVVADTGSGISPQVRQHLFEPLHSTKPMGIGLGLVTARRFVEAHGGAIRLLESRTGASFEIRLPSH